MLTMFARSLNNKDGTSLASNLGNRPYLLYLNVWLTGKFKASANWMKEGHTAAQNRFLLSPSQLKIWANKIGFNICHTEDRVK